MDCEKPCKECTCEEYLEIKDRVEDSFETLRDKIADAVTEFVWVDSDQYEEIRDVVDAILTDSLNYITE